ncbi:MYXO-CTERM domain-containing protein [Mycobacterium sp. BK558]|nr:MYXO-CTERM domain-containing protein [Mycobacterium sp. BK558]
MGDLSDKAQEFAGRAKEAAGDVTGDDTLRAEGAADKTEAEVKQKVDDVKQAVTEKASDIADSAQDKAVEVKHAVTETASDSRFVAVLAVVGAALVAALLLRRRSRTASSGSSRSSGKRHKGRAVATKAVTAGLKEAIVR